MAQIFLKPGREKSVLKKHPWIFSGAVDRIDGNPGMGEVVEIINARGQWLARGGYSPHSQIRVRLWGWDDSIPIDREFISHKLEQALAARRGLPGIEQVDAYRLVHGESDGLPGLIVDRYADHLVVQFQAACVEFWREIILECLVELIQPVAIIEKSDADLRRLEGLADAEGVVYGKTGKLPLVLHEYGCQFAVDPLAGHKTGFYLDQRENRIRVKRYAAGREVLDCFSYTGSFSINCLLGGARTVTSVELSKPAIELAHTNLHLNQIDESMLTFVQEDVFYSLRGMRDRSQSFDMVILDPPKFAPTSVQVEKATRAYKDINLLALKLLNPGGILATFSCSGGVSLELFQKIVRGAAQDAGKDAKILEVLTQAPDHPIRLNFPEGAYLKGFILYVEG